MRKCKRAIRSMGAARQAAGRVSTSLCVAVTTLVLLGACSTAQATEVPSLLNGATGPTGPMGPEGKEGKVGPTGPTGSGGGGGGRETSEGFLAKGKSEKGTWSAAIHVPAGAEQAQADAAISYLIPLHERPKTVYLNEKMVAEPGTVTGCVGSANEPVAAEGYLCVYQGATATPGSLESEWKNAKFFGLEDPAGNTNSLTAGEAGIKGGDLGELVVFRTSEFSETTPITSLAKAASLNAAGSWSVTEKA